MTLDDLCKLLRKKLSAQFRKAYERDLDAFLHERGHELWIVGLDSMANKYIDVCGTIDAADLAVIQNKGFIDADAGYLASAQNTLNVAGKKFDLFMFNIVHATAKEDFIEPIIAHELAHLLEHVGEPAKPEGPDEQNADAILKSLDRKLLNHHPKEWALHLAGAARKMIEKRLTGHKTVRAYLEAAIPEYDRTGPVYAKKSV